MARCQDRLNKPPVAACCNDRPLTRPVATGAAGVCGDGDAHPKTGRCISTLRRIAYFFAAVTVTTSPLTRT